jgi:predicted HicB family RNase H-like nuclease
MIIYKREVVMVNNERKPITIRVSPELKFQIDKEVAAQDRTINSWIIHIIKKELGQKERGTK